MAEKIPPEDKAFLQNFEPDVFWEQHGHKILAGFLVIILVALGMFLRQKRTADQALVASNRLAMAEDAAALESIIVDYPGKEYAARARLRLADLNYGQGDIDAAEKHYQAFLTEFPNHSLVPTARLGLAAVTETRGDQAGALTRYRELGAAGSGQHVAILAKMGAARCSEALGQPIEARQSYEEALALAQGTQLQSSIFLRLAMLGREIPQPEIASEPAEVLQENTPE